MYMGKDGFYVNTLGIEAMYMRIYANDDFGI